ncbi:Di-and tricarboxylate transporter [Prevotella sp. ne3005]|uniref:SLC13 family permease n=1 Tax=Prevotella sp. ne3005 TaxID=1761887 RepID=UPI0008B08568|nr:SLC13 family permease [Prevotella sp. ne3005]SEM77726.1 Di-and tricarboxylate transporter [Prevotella sp. ne3005]
MESFVFLGFNLYAWITIITVLTMFTVLLFTKLRSDLVFLGAISVLYVTGVLNAKEAFSGFSSTSVVIIGVLFVVVAGLTHTGVLQWIVRNLLGQPNSYSKAVVRLMLPVAVLSSFLSNTTVVALFVSIVKMWSKKLKISPSKLLIPLSYASGMGGVCTLIGTPPNLIISGLYAENTGEAMNVLATTIPGLFCLCIGMLSIIAMRKLLPERQAPEAAFESTSDYTVELLVPANNPFVGKTIIQAGLNEVHGGSLIEIVHFDEVVSPVPDKEPIMGGDRLVFAGQIDEILELKKSHGLVNADHHVFSMNEVDSNRQLRTAYVTFGSHLINTKIGESTFEKDNNMTLVAVARRSKHINQSPREVVLQAGDTLLLECSPTANIQTERLASDLQFFDSAQVPNIGKKTFISTSIMIAMVVLSALNVIPLLQCAFLAAMAMLLCRCCNVDQAMKAINWEILMVFAGSVVLGVAIQKTGIAERLAFGILDVCGTNPIVVMTAICLVGTFITEFISNTAAGAMFFPIMYQAAEKLGYEPYPFLIALMVSVSSSFATPIGSPTHMLVYGPGGYRFSDFMRIGLLMNFIILAANILIVNIIYPLTPLQ